MHHKTVLHNTAQPAEKTALVQEIMQCLNYPSYFSQMKREIVYMRKLAL